MSEEMARYEDGLPVLADDTLIHIAAQAEARIDAVIKIKQLALKVSNAGDWVDQDGKPYLMASGSEKIANLFNISWTIDEPTIEQEQDGTITYNYKGEFRLAGRSIQVEGSRSSRDTFFNKYEYKNGEKAGLKPLDRRDLKMAALTNLLGNGITRLLGIRNLTYEDLEAFAGIKKEQVKGVKYKKAGEEGNKASTVQPGKTAGEGEAKKTVNDTLREELNDYCGNSGMQTLLTELTTFEGDKKDASGAVTGKETHWMKFEDIPKVSEKWAGKTLNVLRKYVAAHPKPAPAPDPIVEDRMTILNQLLDKKEVPADTRRDYCGFILGHEIADWGEVTAEQADRLINALRAQLDNTNV